MSSPDPPDLGVRVRQARERAGLTQAALAERAGVTDETIGRLERGAFEPALSTLVAVADALDVDLDSLVRPKGGSAATAREGPVPAGSALTRRLVLGFEVLDPEAQRLVLRLVERLAARAGGAPAA
ncbi:MAG: helix-turn-helix transcriptional regulator [Deltaproteobacteria bacterium]|nr:helix-turn-helix transcriptional regulator [Deltaproteobacteria bacterium]